MSLAAAVGRGGDDVGLEEKLRLGSAGRCLGGLPRFGAAGMGGSRFPGSMFTKLMRGELPTVAPAAGGTEGAGRPSGPYSSANMMSGTSSSTSPSRDASSSALSSPFSSFPVS